MGASAFAELTEAFEAPFAALGNDAGYDRDVVVLAWPSVPVEIVRAAGLKPIFARGAATATRAADDVLETDVFPSRLRQLVEAALTGRLANVAALVLPRTSDADYKCFLYLRELERQGRLGTLPPVLLFDLLQSASPEVADYDRARGRELYHRLAGIGGRSPDAGRLGLEIRRADSARAAVRRLIALRGREPRIRGAEVLPLLGAFWQLPPERYAKLAGAAADAIAARSPLAGPRVLLGGSPVDAAGLSAEIESQGAIVVEEISPYGGSAAGEDVGAGDEPLAALADKYRRDSIDARTPREALWRRIETALGAVDAVVVSLPPDDASFGWDWPRLRATLERRGIPHAVLAGDPASAMTTEDRGRLEVLVASATRQKTAHHG